MFLEHNQVITHVCLERRTLHHFKIAEQCVEHHPCGSVGHSPVSERRVPDILLDLVRIGIRPVLLDLRLEHIDHMVPELLESAAENHVAEIERVDDQPDMGAELGKKSLVYLRIFKNPPVLVFVERKLPHGVVLSEEASELTG